MKSVINISFKREKFTICQWIIAMIIFINGLGVVIDVWDINIVNILSVVAFIAIIIDASSNRHAFGNFIQGKKRYFIILFFLWLVYALFQGVFFGAFQNANGLPVYRQLLTNAIIVYFACYAIKDKNSYLLLCNAIYAVLIVNVIIGIYEIITGNHFSEATSIWDVDSTRAFQSNPNEYATTVYCAFLSLILFAVEKRLSFSKVIVGLLGCVCVYTSNCRGIFYAMILYGLCFLFIQIYYRLHLSAKSMRGLVLLGILLFLLLAVSSHLYDVMKWIVGWISKESDIASDYSRISMIREGMKLFRMSYGLGLGPGQSSYHLGINVHNLFVELLADYGIIIFLPVMLIWWIIWKNAFIREYPRKIRCMYFSLIPSLVLASVISSSILKFKMLWVMLLLFLISDEYILLKRDFN